MALIEGSIDDALRWLAEEHLGEHERRLADLACQLVDLQGTSHGLVGYNACPPFPRRVQKEPILSWFHISQLDPYDGTMNS